MEKLEQRIQLVLLSLSVYIWSLSTMLSHLGDTCQLFDGVLTKKIENLTVLCNAIQLGVGRCSGSMIFHSVKHGFVVHTRRLQWSYLEI